MARIIILYKPCLSHPKPIKAVLQMVLWHQQESPKIVGEESLCPVLKPQLALPRLMVAAQHQDKQVGGHECPGREPPGATVC